MQQMISPPRHGTMINPRASVAGIDAANGQCWYEIRALAAGRVEIFLYDVIGGWGYLLSDDGSVDTATLNRSLDYLREKFELYRPDVKNV